MGRERQYEGVRVASSSTIEIDFRYQGNRCKERLKLEPTPINLKRAAQHRAAILVAIENGTFDYAVTFPKSRKLDKFQPAHAARMTVSELLDVWLEQKKPQIKASTLSGYKKAINAALKPTLGQVLVQDLKRPAIRNAMKTLEVSNKWLTNVQSVLRNALDYAVDEDLIESNPLHGYAYYNAEGPKSKYNIDPFTKDEQVAILAACSGQFRNMIQFAFWTGLRTSEYVALDWSDVDWDRKVVVVSRALTQPAEEAEDTKTSSSRREVKLLGPALEALSDQRAYTLLNGKEIFQNPNTGERWTGDQQVRNGHWKPTLGRAGVRYRRPYQTRHTYASMMLSAGEPPMWVARQLGHSDWSMISRIYGKWMPEALPDAGLKAEQTFS